MTAARWRFLLSQVVRRLFTSRKICRSMSPGRISWSTSIYRSLRSSWWRQRQSLGQDTAGQPASNIPGVRRRRNSKHFSDAWAHGLRFFTALRRTICIKKIWLQSEAILCRSTWRPFSSPQLATTNAQTRKTRHLTPLWKSSPIRWWPQDCFRFMAGHLTIRFLPWAESLLIGIRKSKSNGKMSILTRCVRLAGRRLRKATRTCRTWTAVTQNFPITSTTWYLALPTTRDFCRRLVKVPGCSMAFPDFPCAKLFAPRDFMRCCFSVWEITRRWMMGRRGRRRPTLWPGSPTGMRMMIRCGRSSARRGPHSWR